MHFKYKNSFSVFNLSQKVEQTVIKILTVKLRVLTTHWIKCRTSKKIIEIFLLSINFYDPWRTLNFNTLHFNVIIWSKFKLKIHNKSIHYKKKVCHDLRKFWHKMITIWHYIWYNNTPKFIKRTLKLDLSEIKGSE